MDKSKKPNCPQCGSSTAYVKITTQELVCRRCGAVTPLDTIMIAGHYDDRK